MDPLGDDSHTLEEFFSDLHLIVSHKAVCTQLLEEFRKDVLKPYVKKQNVISFIDDLLAPYANAWLILNRPTDANLPDDIVAMLVSLADYQTTDWKPVAMWALVNSIRNLGSANAQVFSTPGNIGNETTNAHDERLNYTTSTDSTTFSPHSNASPASTASTGKAHSPDAHAPQAPSETSTKAIPSNRSVDSSSPTRTDVPHSRIYVASCRPVPP